MKTYWPQRGIREETQVGQPYELAKGRPKLKENKMVFFFFFFFFFSRLVGQFFSGGNVDLLTVHLHPVVLRGSCCWRGVPR